MSASQRAKGQRGEREAYALLHDALGDIVKRRDLSQSRDGGGDIIIPVARIVVEVKRCQRRSVPSWLDQALATAAGLRGHGCYPADGRYCRADWMGVVLWRKDGGKWLAFVPRVARGVYLSTYDEMGVAELCELIRGRVPSTHLQSGAVGHQEPRQ